MKSRNSDVCVICGERPATTRDHIPPKAIFPSPRPSDLITVPACAQCNNGQSGLDERFKVYLAFRAGNGPQGERLFAKSVSKTLERNERLHRSIEDSRGKMVKETPEGTKTLDVIPEDNEAHDTVIERMIRGLHFHHTEVILGNRAEVKPLWYETLTPGIIECTKTWSVGRIGRDQFIYKYRMFDTGVVLSQWVFEFFGEAWSGGKAIRSSS